MRLVNPKLDWPSEKAHAVSVDAKSIIESTKIYTTLREALSDSTLSIAYTARKRDMSKQFTDNKSIIKEIHDERSNDKLAVVFGGEASGLTAVLTQIACSNLISRWLKATCFDCKAVVSLCNSDILCS